MLTAAVLAVGDELLLGDVVNTNAAWLGAQLAAAGAEVVSSAAVGDHLGRLGRALDVALADADLVVLTGGLGPTVDDLTREAICAVAGLSLERSEVLVDQLRNRFSAYGIQVRPEMLKQADLPRGAQVLDNPVGSAPGLWLELAAGTVVALPGPPHEMRAVAAPVLARVAGLTGRRLVTRQLHTSGLGESAVAARVEAVLELPGEVALAYLAADGVVRVRFTTGGEPAALEPLVDAARDALGDSVWGQDADTLDAVVHRALAECGQSVAVAESLTGGLVAAALSARPGSSGTFRGGLVVYATDLKASQAGVPQVVLDRHGAVAAETALALAHGVRSQLAADWGVGVTGVAGPTEQEGKSVGTVHVAVAGPAGEQVRSLHLPGDRERIRLVSVTAALDLLRRALGAGEGRTGRRR